MKRNSRFRGALGAAFAALVATHAVAAQVVVVSVDSPISALNGEQVSQIFLGRTSALPDGKLAVPIDHAEGSPMRDTFYAKTSGMNATQVKKLQSRLTFSGAMQPSRVMRSDADVKKAVTDIPGGIGYIDPSAVDGSVKVVFTVD